MARTNLEALRAKCKLICDTCYADDDVLIDVLEDVGVKASETIVIFGEKNSQKYFDHHGNDIHCLICDALYTFKFFCLCGRAG